MYKGWLKGVDKPTIKIKCQMAILADNRRKKRLTPRVLSTYTIFNYRILSLDIVA